jgi:hypothetical protein
MNQLLAIRHLLSHVEQQPAVAFFNATEESAETAQIPSIFPSVAPGDVVRALPFRQVRKFGRFFTVIEQLVKRHFHGAGQLFERLDSRNGVTVLDARDIAPKQACALFNVALGKLLGFTQKANAISNNHEGIVA